MKKYILDTNVYIAAEIGYYHHDIVPTYWDVLKTFGDRDLIVSPKQVRDEITSKSVWLSNWKKHNKVFLNSDLPGILGFFTQVTTEYKKVKVVNQIAVKRAYPRYNPSRDEPLSDPDIFVIATALFYKAQFPSAEIILVTKENSEVKPYKTVRIPHLCVPLGIRCIDDFEFIREAGIKFNAICP